MVLHDVSILVRLRSSLNHSGPPYVSVLVRLRSSLNHSGPPYVSILVRLREFLESQWLSLCFYLG